MNSLRSRIRGGGQELAVLVIAVVSLLLLVAFPLVFLIWESISQDGVLTLEHFYTTLTTPRYFRALLTTIYLGVGVALTSVLFGLPMAWGVSRTNMPAKQLVRVLVGVSYVTPALFTAFAYVVLIAPNSGILNRLLVALGSESGPFNAYSLATMILVVSLNTFPFVFFLASSALDSVDASMEEASRILGVSRMRSTIRITLPLVMPAILTGALLSFVQAISLFAAQAVLGLPARVFTLPTRIYSLFTYPPEYGLASSLAIQLLLLTVIGLYLQSRYLKKRGYVTWGGKGTRADVIDLGSRRYFPLAYCMLVFALSLALPLVFLLYASLSQSWVGGLALDNFTLDNYRYILFEYGTTWRSLRNSLVLAAGAATIATAIGVLVAYIDLRTETAGKRLLDYLSILPFGLPGIVIAVAIVQAWVRAPVALIGTMFILLLAYLTRSIPVTVRSANAALRQIDPSLEEAARIVGATWRQSLFHVTAPLMRSGLLAGWILVFVALLTEVSASILLFTNRTITLGVANFNLYDNAQLEEVSALAILSTMLMLAVLVVAWKFGRVRVIANVAGASEN